MSDDIVSDIDSLLADELPDSSDTSVDAAESDHREELIQVLQEAAAELGKSPTVTEFDSLDFDISADQIRYWFESWNQAKAAAGLKSSSHGMAKDINDTYFKSIDKPAKAYWLGTLFGTSSLQSLPDRDGHKLVLGRVAEKDYFISEFASAVDSTHAIHEYAPDNSEYKQVQLAIQNQIFTDHLLDAGYPDPDCDHPTLPTIDAQYRPDFVRGFLESSGYFTSHGWTITMDTEHQCETLQAWFEDMGAKRPSISEYASGDVKVLVSNAFDIRAIFESLYPDGTDTDPSWQPYPRQVIEYLNSEYPYPENVSYLDA